MESEIDRVFKYFDKDSSGFIDLSELGNALRCLGLTPSNAQVEELMKKADANSDRKLGKCEFTYMYNEINVAPKVTLNDLINEFKVFDKDNSGYINAKELDEALCSQGEPMSKDEVRELLNDFDKDKNGRVSIVELATGLLSR
mmetsp:Transcript_9630/g.9589  ORF Transcript_9630/g.9589 Transcript_9630/m.9589 type:complete len:143 (-) Transcript_9630:54-482(-)|eukprot:CAMPEP_0202949452 /NCGR_PEP_ID=MMETSP1395-20130829/15969_1 /ASSEMBLY_ACC=CAM_ASM_000871 /TAXON_ID=5961 /ORGANISM="Blepharisma japonicum, Strain Stock R1072" /LENGTH=142 /DNA_ID=CAMNT_0049652485 /DNA_START=12 /DNA_END=440 /DNA_ORIENTATION=+